MNDIIKQIQQEYRIADDGSVTLSIRGVARLAGVDQSSLGKTLQGGEGISKAKLYETLVEHGFEGEEIFQFSSTGIPDTAAAVIIQYYALLAGRRCTQQAKAVMLAFAAIGIRTWIQNEARWSPLTTKPELETTMPTPEEMDYLRSRQWEKRELEAIETGETPDYRAIGEEFMSHSGFDRAQQAAHTHNRLMAIWKSLQKRIGGSQD